MMHRRCIVCGGSLEGRRRDARCCSASCRREGARWRRVEAGEPDGPYSTIEQLQARRQRRAKPTYRRALHRLAWCVMAEFDGVRVRGRQMTGGFAQAFARLEAARAADDSEAAFYALFESLDWAHAVDEYLARTWRPDGSVDGDPCLWWELRKHRALGAGDVLADVMQGLRYARNRTHHQWADAFVETPGFSSPIGSPVRSSSWAWRPIEHLPTPSNPAKEAPGREAYARALAWRPVQHTLAVIGETFAFLGPLIDPPIPVRVAGPRVEVVAE
jgi:hypothetical protein